MTAEIAIVNRQAIALAADSAVTIGQERVWKNSNKLFSMGPHNDIGVMIYGSGEFAGYPWEMLIKTFRSEVGLKQFDTVSECAKSFMDLLAEDRFTADQVNEHAHYSMFLEHIISIQKLVGSYAAKSIFKANSEKACNDRIKSVDLVNRLPGFPLLKSFRDKYEKEVIIPLARDVFQEVITTKLALSISTALYEIYCREVPSSYSTGIVFAGYGKNEYFGNVINYMVDGKDSIYFRHWIEGSHDANDKDVTKTVIIPFAQKDIFYLFMEGIEMSYIPFLRAYLEGVLNSKSDDLISAFVKDSSEITVEKAAQRKANQTIIEQFKREFAAYRRENVVNPIIGVVRALPKEEMAEMAHALVELTSLRRKVDSPVASVGGPVDVAIITKGDGLVWVKRKHYFDASRNMDFASRKHLKAGGSKNDP